MQVLAPVTTCILVGVDLIGFEMHLYSLTSLIPATWDPNVQMAIKAMEYNILLYSIIFSNIYCQICIKEIFFKRNYVLHFQS